MRYLINLTSPQALPGKPWEFTGGTIPAVVRTDKKTRDAWICSPKTVHNVYSLFEGINENIRVSAPSKDGKGEGNPPYKMHGFVGDYDAPVTEEELLAGCERLKPYVPNYYEKTLSGNSRFIWLFEEPLLLPGYEFAVFFLKEMQERIKFSLLSVGFDKPAFEDPARLFTNSGDWAKVCDKPLNKSLVLGWLVQISEKFAFKGKEFGISIPLDVVATELATKFPTFSNWPGGFELGSQGPTFWLPESSSPKSAIVRETGIQTFSAHATKAFYTWADLLGGTFVSEFESKAIGRAVEGLYHDGKNYYRTIGNKTWKPFSREDICAHLAVTRGLSKKPDKNGISAIDRAIQYVHDFQSVIGVAPFAFRQDGLIRVDGQEVLNTHTRRVLQPADGPVVWGPEGQMPTVSRFLDGFFAPDSIPEKPLDFFLSWASYFYKSCFYLAPRSGQNIFIAGAPGVGKTLLNRAIIGGIMGGHAEAKEYLLGEDDFGSELFEVGHWVIDDSSTTASFSSQKKFSEMIKRMAANRTFRYHAKFRIPTMVNWQGRVIVTCNRDEESIRVLPDLETSILDKLMLFRSAEEATMKFPPQAEMEQILNAELPYFARFLLDYVIPDHCLDGSVSGNRFSVKPYHEQTLVNTANQSSRYIGFLEILEDWKTQHFTNYPDAEFWQGTSLQLFKAIHLDPTVAPAMKPYSVDLVARCVAQLKQKGIYKIESVEGTESGKLREWVIHRTDGGSIKKEEVKEPVQLTESKFQKK